MNFILYDNGLRCFLPPCFSWDVYSIETSKLIERVSLLDISSEITGMSVEKFMSQPHYVTGYITLGKVEFTGKQHRVLHIQDARPASNNELDNMRK